MQHIQCAHTRTRVIFFLFCSELFYVRNHMPVPEVDIKEYELQIDIEGSDRAKTFKLVDIYAMPKHNVTATIMCGGNRRSEMTRVKPVKGLSWGTAAVGNAVWSGPRLCDILKEMGIESNETQHVHVSITCVCQRYDTHFILSFIDPI